MQIYQAIDIKFTLSDARNYGITEDGRVFNIERGNELKRTVIGTTYGYCINGKFKSLKALRKKIVKIEKQNCPF